ncbi:hypothetical protein [Nocardioides humi]|uniref:PH domain-containing protein n=1 Tax=Nocardioides humi TaxID=449461 RepID=A0ABN2B7D3_9ACTN|nr:hypothetical protein [Nocardioides humi]
MDVRLPAPAGRPPRSALVAIVVGAVLLVAPLVAIASRGLDPFDRLDALMLALAGLVILGWGGFRVGSRPLLRHATALRLDDAGVALQGPDAAALLRWPDLAVVEVAWWEIVPPYVEEAEHLPVLRFVARDDGAIALNGAGRLATRLGQSFRISPPAAALTVVLGAEALDPLHRVLDWLEQHRGDVPVAVGEPPEL